MRQNHYIVIFDNGKSVFVSAFNMDEAEIFAKATMIKNGLSYEVKYMMTTTNLADMTDTDFVV